MLAKLRQARNKAFGHWNGAMFLTLALEVFPSQPSLIALHDGECISQVVMGPGSSLDAPLLIHQALLFLLGQGGVKWQSRRKHRGCVLV